jgi:hypothetical protein
MAQVLYDIAALHTFDAARSYWQNVSRWPGQTGDYDARPLGPANRKRYLTIRQLEPTRPHIETFACRYHKTDVVVWMRDASDPERPIDTCTVTSWSSRSTEALANTCTPYDFRFRFADSITPHVIHNQRAYAVDNHVTLVKPFGEDWRITDAAPFPFIVADPKSIRAAFTKTKYYQYLTWLRARINLDLASVIAFTDAAARQRSLAARQAEKYGVLGLLDRPNKWEHLTLYAMPMTLPLSEISTYHLIDGIKAFVEHTILREHKGVFIRECEWCPEDQLARQRTLSLKYDWL